MAMGSSGMGSMGVQAYFADIVDGNEAGSVSSAANATGILRKQSEAAARMIPTRWVILCILVRSLAMCP